MPARTGEQYIQGIQKAKNNVWIHGEKVDDVASHPAFRNTVRSIANLYDLQHEKADKMLYTSEQTGDQVGLSFIAPKTVEDLIRRREMISEWAGYTGGMMGRTPDYLNTSVMAFGTSGSFFAQDDPMFAENAKKYYDYCRENDVSLTHTLIHPQTNRSKKQSEQKDPYLSARIVEKNKDGIVIKGARLLATLGGVTDEIVVFPSTLNKASAEDDPYAMAFAIPNNTEGLKFLCRESFDTGRSQWDHPLSSRFEESDAIVVFDNVLVPWERVFVSGNSDICNRTYVETNAIVHMAHQVIAKNTVKTEFVLGVILNMMESIGIDVFPHVKEKASEVMLILETMRSHLYRAEHNASIDKYGNMTPDFAPLNAARNWYPKMYQRIVEIVRILGASGLMGIPTEADFKADDIGELVHRYTQGANIDGYERVQLFRLAWDISVSSFGGRQALYEYYFFGDPARMSNVYYDQFNKEPYKVRVQDFLKRVNSSSHNYTRV